MNTAAEAGLEVKVPTGLEVATAIPTQNRIRSVSHPPSFNLQYSALLVFLCCFLDFN